MPQAFDIKLFPLYQHDGLDECLGQVVILKRGNTVLMVDSSERISNTTLVLNSAE